MFRAVPHEPWRGEPACHIRSLRQKLGLTQHDLAMAVGVHATTISVAESGGKAQPSRRIKEDIAFQLGVTFADIWPSEAAAS